MIKCENNKCKFTDNNYCKKNVIFEKGISVKKIVKLSKLKHEPNWMLKIRLKAFNFFKKMENPYWQRSLNKINFDDFIYYFGINNKWELIPKNVKETFKNLNVHTKESKFISGINNQYNSESVLQRLKKNLFKKGVIYTSLDIALKKYPKIVKKYFSKLVSINDNKYAALNTAVWSGGSFVYIPGNVILDEPLSAYFRINDMSIGQFERTLIIVEKNSSIQYIEGCTAPIYVADSLHAAVVEIFIADKAKCRYITIQNWSSNVINLVTKRAITGCNAQMEWIDGNIGSKINLKYPTTILKGDNSISKCISISIAGKGIIQDTGAKMIHIGKNTKSQIISKSIAHNGGVGIFRGKVDIQKNSLGSNSDITCDSLIFDKISTVDTIPTEIVSNNESFLKHEARTTDIDKEKLFYLNSRGINDKKAKSLLTLGFIKVFSDAIPIEYAVELNRLFNFEN